MAAAALTGTAGGGWNGITALLRGWGGTESDASCTGFSTELDEATGTTLALELPPPNGKNESIPREYSSVSDKGKFRVSKGGLNCKPPVEYE